MAQNKKKRQLGWGGTTRRRQRGWGRRRIYRRRGLSRRQRGRGPKWDKFSGKVKSVAKRAWNKIVPAAVSAGKKAIPHVASVIMSKGDAASKKEAAKGSDEDVWKGHGQDHRRE